MNRKVGIWIDHKKAVIVSASAGRVTATTLESEIGPHARYSGPQDGGGEKKYEDRYGQHLDQYYDEVISQRGNPRLFSSLGRVRPSCNSRSVSAARRRCPSVLLESRRPTS